MEERFRAVCEHGAWGEAVVVRWRSVGGWVGGREVEVAEIGRVGAMYSRSRGLRLCARGRVGGMSERAGREWM